MDAYDPETARQVWQRVHAPMPAPAGREALLASLALVVENRACYRLLAQTLRGNRAAVCRRLLAGTQSQAACLAGLHRLLTGLPPDLSQPVPQPSQPEAALRRCYGRTLTCLSAWSAPTTPDLAPPYRRLARQAEDHCLWIAELLGEQ